MNDELPPLPELVPCPMCGNPDGYFLQEGCTYRWWNVLCKKCGRIIDECASDRRTTTGTVLPSRWPAADETWNEAGAYARAAVLAERERNAEIVLQELGDTGQAKAIAAAIRAGTTKRPPV